MKNEKKVKSSKRKAVVLESTDKKKMSVVYLDNDDTYTSVETKQLLYKAAEHVGNYDFSILTDVD